MSDQDYFTKEWIASGRVIKYRFSSVGKDAADLWYADLAALFVGWSFPRPLYILLDMRMGSILVSSQGLMRARQLSKLHGDLPGRTAVLIDSGLTAQIISGLMRSLGGDRRQRAVFNQESVALAWLLQNDATSTAEIKQAPPPDFEG